MKRIVSLIIAFFLALQMTSLVFAEETVEREAAKNKAKESVVVDNAGYITDHYSEYLKELSLLLNVPDANGCYQLLNEVGMAGVHPRILATKEDFEIIKERIESDEFVSLLYLKQKEYAANLMTQPLATLDSHRGDKLRFAREVVDRMVLLGMLYHITGNPDYVEYAQSQIEIAMKDSVNWVNDVLQTAEMTAAMAIAYDWFYDALEPSVKEDVKNYLMSKMGKISVNYYPTVQGFARQINNWNGVCNGSYGLAAIALLDEEPEFAGSILSGAANAIALSIDELGPDGGFPEGPGYWAYQIQYIAYFLSACESALKTDFGLAELEGLKRTAFYTMHMHGPTYTAFNYADSGEGKPQTQYFYWFAKKYGYHGLMNYANAINPAGTDFSSWEFKSTDSFIMLWYQPTEKSPYEGVPEGGVYHGKVPVASLRTRWDDPNATYVGFKGGYNQVSHGNLDIGSFVLDALGQRWVSDFGSESDYNLEGYWDYAAGRWNFYSQRAEGHNTIVINPSKSADQNPYAHAEISEFQSENGNGYGIVDMKTAYQEHANSAMRGIALCGDSVLVKDEIALKDSSEVLWGINTKADISLSDDKKTAILSLFDKRMQVSIIEPSNATFEVLPAESLSVKPIAGAKTFPNFSRLVTRGIYSGDVNITVQFTAFTDGESMPETFSSVSPLSEWKNGKFYISNGIAQTVKLNGVLMEDFSPSKLGYTIALEESETVPVISAEHDRINSSITIEQAESIGDVAKIIAVSKDPRIGKMIYTFRFEEKKSFGKPKHRSEIKVVDATASTDQPKLSVDGRLDTCWACEGEQWLLLDLGEKQTVDVVAIAFRSGMERIAYFDIEVSDDGEAFTKVFSGEASGISNDYENFKLHDVNARYVKIICKGSSTSAWASINEVALFH